MSRFPGSPQSCFLCEVPEQHGHCVGIDGQPAQAVEHQPDSLRQVRPNNRYWMHIYVTQRSFTGHVNEKNFVGLATDGDYVTCGSENNGLYVYYKVTWHICNKGRSHIDFSGTLEASVPVQVRCRPVIPGPGPERGGRQRVCLRGLLESKQQRDGGRQQPGNH